MTDFKQIYATQAARYEQMVAREDYEGNLLPALGEIWLDVTSTGSVTGSVEPGLLIRPFTTQTIVELGAGTGRLTRLLVPHARCITALDISPHMLGVAREQLDLAGFQTTEGRQPARSISLAAADNRHLPIAAETADLAIVGWSLGHFTGWHPGDWPVQIGQSLAEMRRVLRPGGAIIILETLGTGRETPQPPTSDLAAYYDWLENEHGFHHTWIRTDYRFASVDEAETLTRFFFGDDLAGRIRRDNLTILPECTGIWWRTV